MSTWVGDAIASVLDFLADVLADDGGDRRRIRGGDRRQRTSVSEGPEMIRHMEEKSAEDRDALADGIWNDVERDGLVWFWDPDGQPISLRQWVDLFTRVEELGLRWETKLPDGTFVRTAWLGTNDGHPLPRGVAPQANWGTLIVDREIFAQTREQARRDHRLQARTRWRTFAERHRS